MLLEQAQDVLLRRMILKEARTPQIKACTNLGDRKIREHYESYLGKKGKSGRQCTSLEFFFKPARAAHSSIAAARLIDMDLHKKSLASVEGGHALCDAHDSYLEQAYRNAPIPTSACDMQISFENLWILSTNFLRTEYLVMEDCKNCKAPFLKRAPLNIDACPFCATLRNVSRTCKHCGGPQDENRHCISLDCRRKRDRARQAQQSFHALSINLSV